MMATRRTTGQAACLLLLSAVRAPFVQTTDAGEAESQRSFVNCDLISLAGDIRRGGMSKWIRKRWETGKHLRLLSVGLGGSTICNGALLIYTRRVKQFIRSFYRVSVELSMVDDGYEHKLSKPRMPNPVF